MNKTRKGLSWKDAGELSGKISTQNKLKRIKEYKKTPKLCFFCKSSLSYDKRRNKFCTRSCAASFNNMGIARNFKEDTYEEYIKERNNRNNYTKKGCLHCNKITSNIRFCSRNCLSEYKKQQRREKIEATGALEDYKVEKWYLIEKRSHQCEVCHNEKWNWKDIPLDLHHKDGNSNNNVLDNLLLICPNCHRQTDNFGSKNKGKGRKSLKKC